METEFYGEGQHNGGVYFWGNLNPYIYTYQNPIKYIDPNGKQGIPGMIVGGLTEYLTIVGERMVFEDMDFSTANKAWSMEHSANVGIAMGIGFISGTAKFGKFMASSVGKRIMKEVGVAAVENFMKMATKSLIENEKMSQADAEKLVIGTLTEFGLGKLLPTPAKKNLDKAKQMEKYYKNSKYWKAVDAKNTRKAAERLNNAGEVFNGTIEQTESNQRQKEVNKRHKK